MWNFEGYTAFAPGWAAHLEPCGYDRDGNIIWTRAAYDFRERIVENMI
jgi:hypothetical protein